ncbi:MAG: hypothetical protein AAF654_11400 [Myxococcota bacterium]
MAALLFATFLNASPAEPLVVHVVVLLADNLHQGIVPTTPALGNGQDPKTNLYWGALYGLDTHLPRNGWARIRIASDPQRKHIARAAFQRRIAGRPVVILGEAWDGRHGKAFLERYLLLLSGDASTESIALPDGGTVQAGSAADLVVYIGHNVLMDFDAPSIEHLKRGGGPPTVILACQSAAYFQPLLTRLKTRAPVSTTGNMAPEAYTLVGVVEAMARKEEPSRWSMAAARAYAKYQKIPISAARRLFVAGP